jgi:hypothetical protein
MSSMQVKVMGITYYGYYEDDVLDGILGFDEFRRFYAEVYEPQKIRISVDWYVCNEIWENFRVYAFQGVGKNTGKDYVCLEWLPVTPNDAFLVAHELEHIIRKYNGQQLSISTMSSLSKAKDIATSIGSMFDDPLVNCFLQEKYNFDPAYHYTEIELHDCFNEVGEIVTEPTNDIIRMLHIFFYANQLLRWDSIKDTTAIQKWVEYQRFLRSKWQSIAESGEELYDIVKKYGYDTPEKQRRLFNKIAYKYTINGIKLCDLLYISQ